MRSNQFTININTSTITGTPQQSSNQNDVNASQPSFQQRPTTIPSKIILPPLPIPSYTPPYAPYRPNPNIEAFRTNTNTGMMNSLVHPPVRTTHSYQSFAPANFSLSMTNPFPFTTKATLPTPTTSRPLDTSKHVLPIDLTQENPTHQPSAKILKPNENLAQRNQNAHTEHEIFETTPSTTAPALTTTKSANESPTIQSHGLIFKLSKRMESNKYYLPIDSGNKNYPYIEVPEGTNIIQHKNIKGYDSYFAQFTDENGKVHKQQVYDITYKRNITESNFLFYTEKPITVDQFITMRTVQLKNNSIKYFVKVNESEIKVYKRYNLRILLHNQKITHTQASIKETTDSTTQLAASKIRSKTQQISFPLISDRDSITDMKSVSPSIGAVLQKSTLSQYTSKFFSVVADVSELKDNLDKYENEETSKTKTKKFVGDDSSAANTCDIESKLGANVTNILTANAIVDTSTIKDAEQKIPIEGSQSVNPTDTDFTDDPNYLDAIETLANLAKRKRKQ